MTKIHVFENLNPQDRRSNLYLAAYRAWHETWSEEYRLLGANGTLYSDKFTRQDQVLAVFVNGRCAALSLFHLVDISTEIGRADSWLEGWPQATLDQLNKLDSHVWIWSALTVAKEFRGQRTEGFSVSKVLSAACVHHFNQDTDHQIMIGSTRNKKGINSIVSPYGAQTLATVEINAEPTDLVYFRRREIPQFAPDLQALIDKAWVRPRLLTLIKAA